VRRTWSPRGQTPILRRRFGWKKASMAAALGYRPGGTAARLCFHLQQPAYNTDLLIGVLDQLKRFYAGQPVVLIWDGLSSHWSTRMRAYVDSQRDWLRTATRPFITPPWPRGRRAPLATPRSAPGRRIRRTRSLPGRCRGLRHTQGHGFITVWTVSVV
jgi:hypothetical protein